MPAVQVVRAVRGHQHHPGTLQGADQIREQFTGGAIGPVQVLDRQHHSAIAGQPLEKLRRALEKPGPPVLVTRRGTRTTEIGQQDPEVLLVAPCCSFQLCSQHTVQLAQRSDQRSVRKSLSAYLQAVTQRGDGSGLLRRSPELLQQPGLTDPRLTPNQHNLRLTRERALQRAIKSLELTTAADED